VGRWVPGQHPYVEELAARDGRVFLPCQFSNEANADAHMKTTGPEIWHQLRLQA